MAGDRVRDEADRLVAAAIAAISYAARGFGASSRPGAGFATGSPECCVCPVCRAIAALRDPGPEFADRLAAGVSDLAAGVSTVLRTLQRSGERDTPTERPVADGDEFWESLRRKAADAAKAAARTASTVDPNVSSVDDDPWRAATADPPAPRKPVAKKAVARKAPAPSVPAQPTAAAEPVAPKAVTKKAVAKKAVAKKAAPRRATGTAGETPA